MSIKPYAIKYAKEQSEAGDTLEAIPQDLSTDTVEDVIRPKHEGQREELTDAIFDPYEPSVTMPGARPHPGALVESAANGGD